MSSEAERARSFGALADLYDRVRPGYPPEAVAAVLPEGATRVADVGAGTGKLTASLVGLGLEVVTVEPDPAMRKVLAERVPGADHREGAAEALPIGYGEVDAVCFGQSWHWTDAAAAADEAARVLRPGGTLGLLWNMDDDRVGWVRELKRVTLREERYEDFDGPWPLAGFCSGHRRDVPWAHRISRPDFVDLVSTWSAVSTLPGPERHRVLSEVDALLGRAGVVAADGTIEFPEICAALTYHVI